VGRCTERISIMMLPSPSTFVTLMRWIRLLVTILLVVLEWVVRELVIFVFNIIPIQYFISLFRTPKIPQFNKEEEEMEMDVCEFIENRGFKVEKHFATTPDSYIIGLQRIPYKMTPPDGADEPVEDKQVTRRGVVLFIHGFMQSSEAFVIRKDVHNSIPLVLASAGYDVWLGNNRGNKYSCKHTSKKASHDDFWDFCLDEMIRYDLPTMIEYVLAQSGAETLTIIGFSQGTAQSFACLSSNSQIAKRVNLFIALAPVSAVKGFSNPVVDNLARSRPDFVFLLFGKRAILPSAHFWRKILSRSLFVTAIDKAILFLFGWTAQCIDPAEKALLYSHIYSFSSTKTVCHWFQIIQSSRFQMFDDAMSSTYSSSSTGYSLISLPQYCTNQLQCPVACFYGGKDNLPNTSALLSTLPKEKLVFLHKEDEYEHLDFMWAKDTGKKICPKILNLLDKYCRK